MSRVRIDGRSENSELGGVNSRPTTETAYTSGVLWLSATIAAKWLKLPTRVLLILEMADVRRNAKRG